MSDEEKKWNKKDKPTYIMIPRNLMRSFIAAFVVLFICFGITIQWFNFVDRRSNQRWCKIVVLFDNANLQKPPTDEFGTQVALEFHSIRKEWCS